MEKKSKRRDRSPSKEKLQKKLKKIQEKLTRKGEKVSPSNNKDDDINLLTSKDSGKL